MKNKHYRKLTIAILGYVVVPLLYYLPFATNSLIENNYTAIINNPMIHTRCLYLIPTLLFEFYMLEHIGRFTLTPKKWHNHCVILAILAIIVVLIPYHEQEDFLSGLHVFVGYLALILLNWMLLIVGWKEQVIRNFYLVGFALTFFVIMYYMSITGLAQVIYTWTLSFTLTTLYLKLNADTW